MILLKPTTALIHKVIIRDARVDTTKIFKLIKD